MASDDHYLAVDIGGTKLAAAIVTGSGQVVRQREVPTPSSEPEHLVTRALTELVADVCATTPPAGIGVASAGPIDTARGTISPVNIPAWREFPVVDAIAEAVGGPPPRLIHDSTAAALGEHWRGAGAGSSALLGIVVSTGIGGGLVLDGRPVSGAAGNAGFIGHITADPVGEHCACGRTGCIETGASGPAMLRWARANGWTGHSTPELAAAAATGDATAVAAFRRGAEFLAGGIITSAILLDLDRVVIAGGVSAAGEVLLGPLRAAVIRDDSADIRELRIVRAELGRHSGLIGAARHAMTP
ncbi:ROK family protein [Kitasatospora sp. NBC_00240]|uniref:ROK family protein n=1 Tax=Kitasatospora sp. NBC_00240 TaxID=2903567 RepID=UPI00225BFB8B|nr:ROK family protein [Kitasatospora sp. NBC_00240]MCX5208405.1 ROK family protein [Kitasatospora sp. NBC_00240]